MNPPLPDYVALVPARNEGRTIERTLQSLRNQSHPPSKLIILDDFSEDDYSEIVRRTYPDAEIRRTNSRHGKAYNINRILPEIATEYVLVVDADTHVEKDFVKKLLSHRDFDVAYGQLLPDLSNESIYANARLVEYLYGHAVWKQATSFLGTVNITGCFALYKSETLKRLGGYPRRTITEDTDLSWLLSENGCKIMYVQEAKGYTAEPSTLEHYHRQIKRWHTGFWQTIKVHGKNLGNSNRLMLLLDIVLLDTLVFAPILLSFLGGSFLFYLSKLWLLKGLFNGMGGIPFVGDVTVVWQRWFPFASNETLALITVLVDFCLIAAVTLVRAKRLGLVRNALLGLPVYYILAWYSRVVFWRAAISVLRYRPIGSWTW